MTSEYVPVKRVPGFQPFRWFQVFGPV